MHTLGDASSEDIFLEEAQEVENDDELSTKPTQGMPLCIIFLFKLHNISMYICSCISMLACD